MRTIFLITIISTLPFYRSGFTEGRPFALASDMVYAHAAVNALCCVFFIVHARFFSSLLQAWRVWRYLLLVSLFFAGVLATSFFLKPESVAGRSQYLTAIVLARSAMLFLIVWTVALLAYLQKAGRRPSPAAHAAPEEQPPMQMQNTERYWTIKSDYSEFRIPYGDILLLEALGDYVKVHLKNGPKPIITRMTLKSAIGQMPEGEFAQTHRSCAIRIDQVVKIRQAMIQLSDGREVPVGARFRAEIKRLFQ
jgi:hypothetical protein